MDDQETREELNRLYWESEHSVAEIADHLEISRRALYDGIEPRSAGAPCPECGATLGFRNRTSAESREAECADCGHEVRLQAGGDRGQGQGGSRSAQPQLAEPQVEQERVAAPLSPTRRVPVTEESAGAAALGVMLLAGLGLGAAAAYLIRRG